MNWLITPHCFYLFLLTSIIPTYRFPCIAMCESNYGYGKNKLSRVSVSQIYVLYSCNYNKKWLWLWLMRPEYSKRCWSTPWLWWLNLVMIYFWTALTPVAMTLAKSGNRIVVCHEDTLKLLAPSQFQEMIGNVNKLYIFSGKYLVHIG